MCPTVLLAQLSEGTDVVRTALDHFVDGFDEEFITVEVK